MDELRLVRRDDQSLIVNTEAGTEFRLIVDAAVLAEIRQMQRRDRDTPRVSPRDIQRMLRAGKTHAEIVTETGAEESDIVRYEEPVLAERRFILTTAHSVSVRTTNTDGTEQQFGEVMEERLNTLNAEAVEWNTWKDEETGWMLGLEFISHDIAHHAIWSFDHKKSHLTPNTPDAVTLSRQGEVGDRLIPKLRAVETQEQRHRGSSTFNPEILTQGLDEQTTENTHLATESEHDSAAEHAQPTTPPLYSTETHEDTQPVLDPQTEFLRRREIEQRSMSTSAGDATDLNETSDLLDALRKRRSARENETVQPAAAETSELNPPAQLFPGATTAETGPETSPTPVHTEPIVAPRVDPFSLSRAPRNDQQATDTAPPNRHAHQADAAEDDAHSNETAPTSADKPKRKGRASIPSWDDILFGTRSEEDPV